MNVDQRINTLIMRGLSATEATWLAHREARLQPQPSDDNPLRGLINAFDAERERVLRSHL